MKTTDLTPGVIYAEQRSRFGTPTAVVFIDTTIPVHAPQDRYGFRRDPKSLLPDLSAAPSARAYLAVAGGHADLAEAASQIAKLTVDALIGELAAAEKKVPKGLALAIVRPRDIKSTWDDHVASVRRQQEARERAEVLRAEEASLRECQEAALTNALLARGLKAERFGGDVRLSDGTATMKYEVLLGLLDLDPVE